MGGDIEPAAALPSARPARISLTASVDCTYNRTLVITSYSIHYTKLYESAVIAVWMTLLPKPGYWQSWYLSFIRVFEGFIAAQIIGIPFGLGLAVNRYFRGIFFPPFEVLRPIPPLAWVPASLIFWPTQELSIAFVTVITSYSIHYTKLYE